MSYRKKLIEVALPLEEINNAAAREKSIRHGHPSTLHLWWARRPLASCRAVLFASIIDDPEQDGVPQPLLDRIDKLPIPHQYRPEWKGLTEAEQRRKKLFGFIATLVQWESSNDPDVLATARELIHAACLPPLPPEADDFVTINEQGHKFNGYKAFGDENGECGPNELYRAVGPVIEEYRRSGAWRGSLRELRGALFYLLREYRATDMGDPLVGDKLREFQSVYAAIRERWDEVEPDLPPVLDPFAGGGSIPLEAQRLGLEAHASDLNPVAVLINKAQIEIPPKFAGQPPTNPASRSAGGKELKSWQGAQGLAEDVRYYGQWMREEAEKRIGYLYPKTKLPKEYGGGEATVIAWIWARTVKSPNPAARGAHVPLVRSFALSTKKGKEVWAEPVVDMATMTYHFEIRTAQTHPGGKPREGSIGKRGGTCVLTGAPLDLKYVRAEAQAGRMGARLMAVVAEGQRGRIYLPPTEEQERTATEAHPLWKPDGDLPKNPRDFKTPLYGMTTWADLFTMRQLTALSTFSELVGAAREKVKQDAASNSVVSDPQGYADALATYLGFAASRASDAWSSIVTWRNTAEATRGTFARQALPMTWDFAEANPFSRSCGNWAGACLEWIEKALISMPAIGAGQVRQQDAVQHGDNDKRFLITTDPPYYDNISYAALSDFFYVWMRHTLADVYPELYGTIATPKAPELIADPHRQGGKEAAKAHFEDGMRRVFRRICETALHDYPVTVIYAFKQSETESEDGEHESGGSSSLATASTGWETFLSALTDEGFQVTGTWPMRTERAGKITAGTNILASSIALVCRPRPDTAATVTRPEFQRALKREIPRALIALQQGNVAPVDLQQSAIGPGMAVFSRYKSVLEASGKPMTVRTALQEINKTLGEMLDEQEGTYDEATRWAVTWFSQYGFTEAQFGKADDLARAKNVAVEGLASDGIVRSGGGVVKLLTRDELPADYDPAKDKRVTVWEATQYLARELDQKGIEAAGRLMARFRAAHPDMEVERARDLAYRLFDLSEKKKWSAEARPYNALVASWSDIEAQSQEPGAAGIAITGGLFGDE